MVDREILTYCLNTLKDQVDKCDCLLTQNKKYELNLEDGKIALLRTTIDHHLRLRVLKDHKRGTISINKTDKQSIDEAIENVLDICENSEPDEAFDIAPTQEKEEFAIGDTGPDLDRMYDLLDHFVKTVNQTYPTIKLMDTLISFDTQTKYLMNSNEVDFKQEKGMYSFSSLFAAKEGQKMSSFNYSMFSMKELDKELIEYASINTVLKQTTEQLDTKSIEGKFEGDVIFTPDCLNMLVQMYVGVYLMDMPLISGTSPLKDQLNKQVANEKLTLHSNPISKELADGYHITGDGFKAENMTIIEDGILKSFMLSQYGANKTKLDRANNLGGAYIIEAGNESFDEMIQSIDKGVLVQRISGGNPNNNGDLSVVLKNSYYVENGEIKYPLSESTITFNLNEAFQNIKELSKERINFGSSLYPYVKVGKILISGK